MARRQSVGVAPSRARGLKLPNLPVVARRLRSRALTGAWIETIRRTYIAACRDRVAPSRARGLKHRPMVANLRSRRVAPSRARGLKRGLVYDVSKWLPRRALTGAWIETIVAAPTTPSRRVAPSRARGLKRAATFAKIIPATGRALTGAWIETISGRFARPAVSWSRPHGRVD